MTIQVFVSYRRGDSSHAAGRLVDRLDEHFKLFIDVDRIRPGADFTSVVRAAVDKSDVLVAVIGLQWLTLAASDGGRRIDQPGDWVAEEVGTALRRGTLVIPVLVDGAQMPSRAELPEALADLANRQALRIAHESFAADSRRLIETIEEMVSAATPQTVNLWDDPDYPAARGAFLQELWPAAIEGFERTLHRYPRQQQVTDQLEQARRNQHLLDLDAIAANAADAGRWQEVVDALQAIDALQPTTEVKERLTQAQLSLRIAELHNDVRALAKTGNWKAVLAADAELARLDADAADLEGLATKARAALLEADLAASYARAVEQLDHRDWAGAESTLVALLDRRAGYRDAEPLLALAQRQGTPATLDTALDTHPEHDTSGAGRSRPELPDEHLESPPVASPATAIPSPPRRPRPVVIGAAAGAVVLVVLVAVAVATLGDRTRQGGGDPSTALSPAPSTPVPSVTAAAPDGLPVSTALPASQLIVTMRGRGGNWDFYLGDATVDAPVKRLTDTTAAEIGPVLSPSRQSIIYVRGKTNTAAARTLRVAAADLSGDRELFPLPRPCVRGTRPAWDPTDPTLLALPCVSADGAFSLRLIRVDGTVVRTVPGPPGNPRVDDPAFSPDGKTLAFFAEPNGPWDGGALYTVPVTGGEPTRLFDDPPMMAGQDADPVYSPDGRYIAFRRRLPVADKVEGQFDLFRVNTDGTGLVQLTRTAGNEGDPSWSPDSTQIAFGSTEHTDAYPAPDIGRAWVMNADGSARRLLWTKGAPQVQVATSWTGR